MYKIETHMHTNISSKCGWLNAEEACKAYTDAGYQGVAVTDHFNRTTVSYLGIDLLDKAHAMIDFFKGARAMQALAPNYGLSVYQCTELRFDGSENDYLIFGFEPGLFYDPDSIMKDGLEVFSARCREAGALIIQAHPFRPPCTPAPPELIDGVEVANLNLRHESNNALALAYAKKHNLLMTAGSDCHRPYNVGKAGILSPRLPKDSSDLADLIRSEQYYLFSVPERIEVHQ